MKLGGICSVCGGEAKPVYSCILCGNVCCDRCYMPEKNICKKCSFKS